MRSLKKHLAVTLSIITSIIAFDQITKVLARTHLKPADGSRPEVFTYLGDLVRITYAENRGAFLSMGNALPDGVWELFMTIVPTIFIVGFFVYLMKNRTLPMTETIIYSGIIAGGLGNLYDRFVFGYVTDFINFGIGPSFRTGILNIADIPITMGIIYLLFYYMIKDIIAKKTKK